MDPRIADYIRTHRRRYTREAIREQLVDAGYAPEEIDATWAALDTPDADSTAGEGFWSRFWLFLLGINVAVFLLVGFATGLFGAIAQGGAPILLVILAIALGIGALLSWGAVAATRPTKLGRGTALAIGAIVPLIFALLIGGTCYALVGTMGPPLPPPRSGTVELVIDPPLDFEGSGVATCQAFPDGTTFNVFAERLGTHAGRAVSISMDGFVDQPGAAGNIGLYISLNPEDGPAEPFASYTNMGGASIEFDGSPDGLSGTVTFENLAPEPIERPPGEAVPEPISGSVTWQCE